MGTNVLLALVLLLVVVCVIMLAKWLRVAYPVLLVFAGLLISFIPGLPKVTLEPELIFVIFLPPILYDAAWSASFKELFKWRRIILSFAFVIVFVTAISVASVSYWVIPGFTLSLGFLLGGIVSPPDAVSANAITNFIKVPKRFSTILEGESLLNDASSLIIMQFAIIAVTTGKFDLQQASLRFVWMIVGGVGCGLLLGWLFLKLHKLLPTDANIDVILTLVGPYLMYILAEEVHASGVLSVVVGSLFLSEKQYEFLSSSSRVRGVNVWESFIFLLNGIVFILIGLDLPQITEGLGSTRLIEAMGYGVLITAVVILVRIASSYGAVGVTLIMRNFITVADPNPPGKKVPLILGWTGMRGVVSLAAALSIPIYLENGDLFPQRNLILFITFIVILLTLSIQGLTLPLLIKKAELKETDHPTPEPEVEKFLEREIHQVALKYMQEKFNEQEQNSSMCQNIMRYLQDKLKEENDFRFNAKTKAMYLEILEQQRNHLVQLNKKEAELNEDIVRRKIMTLDYQEERLNLKAE